MAGAIAVGVILVVLVAWLATRGGPPSPAHSPTSPPVLQAGRTVTQLDPATGRVLKRAPAPAFVPGGAPEHAIALGEGGLWVVGTGGLTHIDPSTGGTKATINAAGSRSSAATSGVAVGARSVWVIAGGANPLPGILAEVNPATDQVLKTVQFGTAPTAVAVGFGDVWVVDATSGNLFEFDALNLRRVKTAPLGGSPVDIAVGEGAVWVCESVGQSLTRYDPQTGRWSTQKVTGADGVAVGFGSVWVIDSTAGTLTRIDPSTGAGETKRVGNSPTDVGVGGGFIWVANSRDGTVSRVDPATGAVSEIHLGGRPTGVAADDQTVWILAQSVSHPRTE